MNNTLAQAVCQTTGDDIETVNLVIHAHQQAYPGSWQEWELAPKTAQMVRLMNAAWKANETAPERIVRLDFVAA